MVNRHQRHFVELENQHEEQQIAGAKQLDIISVMNISLADCSKRSSVIRSKTQDLEPLEQSDR